MIYIKEEIFLYVCVVCLQSNRIGHPALRGLLDDYMVPMRPSLMWIESVINEDEICHK